MTEPELVALVFARYLPQGFAVFRNTPAPPVEQGGRPVVRVIDAVAFKPEGPVLAFEAKSQRKDFLADVRRPEKQAPWVNWSTEHWYVTTPDVAHPSEVPSTSGLLHAVVETFPDGHQATVLRVAKEAPQTSAAACGAPSWLVGHALREASTFLSALHGWTSSGDDVVDLRAALNRATIAADTAARDAARAREKGEAWQMLAAAQGHKVACADCGAAITPRRISAGVPAGWRHAQPHLTGDCPANQTGIRPREDSP